MPHPLLRPFRLMLAALVCAATALLGAATDQDAFAKAEQLVKANNLTAAAKAYQGIIAGNPEPVQLLKARYGLARVQNDLGEVEDAKAQYALVVAGDAKFPNRRDSLFELAKLQAGDKDHKTAIATIEKLLGEGAGLYEDQALMLAGGWFAVLEKWDDAASKFNVIKRKRDSSPEKAKEAAFKMGLLWVRAGRLDDAVNAITDFANTWPDDERIPELLMKIAMLYKEKGKVEPCADACRQLRTRFPQSLEAAVAGYLLGLIAYDRKEFPKAVAAFEEIGKYQMPSLRAVAAEALMMAAEIYLYEMREEDKAMDRFQAAAYGMRDCVEAPRRAQVLERCYFQLGEYYFKKKRWAVALENYLLLRDLGSELNVFGRILECMKQLGDDTKLDNVLGEKDIARFREAIEKHPNTDIAVEAEIQILQIKARLARRAKRPTADLAPEYERILKTYPAEVVAKNGNAMFCWLQLGGCLETSTVAADKQRALEAFEKALSLVDSPTDSYRIDCIEGIARMAEATGDNAKARKRYRELFTLVTSGDQEGMSAASESKRLGRRPEEYLLAMASRADVNTAQEVEGFLQKLVDGLPVQSDSARESRFQLGELRMIRKDFPGAAKTFKEFIRLYGPPQDDKGDLKTPYVWEDKPLTEQIYQAAIRIAHAWDFNHHEQNRAAAYQWIIKNLPNRNHYLAEAVYVLAMEKVKGKVGESKEAKMATAEALWTGLVSPSFDPKEIAKQGRFWLGARHPTSEPYLKTGILKAGQFFAAADDHERAALCFQLFVDRWVRDPAQLPELEREMYLADDQIPVARYALGAEYAALGDLTRLIKAYTPYLNSLREDRFRLSALQILAYHAGKADRYDAAVEAYGAILDEYGENPVDPKTKKKIPIPAAERLRKGQTNWDGIRMAKPAKLDLGEMRYNLGFLYFTHKDYPQAALALSSFDSDEDLAKNPSRDRALFMLGQSRLSGGDAKGAAGVLAILRTRYPDFQSEEACTWLGRAQIEAKLWADFDKTYQVYLKAWPNGDRRPRMDLYAARAQLGRGAVDKGMAALAILYNSDSYQDLRSEAAYLNAATVMSSKPPRANEAMPWFEKSIAVLATERNLAEGARCAQILGRLEQARDWSARVLNDFPNGDAALLAQAKECYTAVTNELAKKKPSANK